MGQIKASYLGIVSCEEDRAGTFSPSWISGKEKTSECVLKNVRLMMKKQRQKGEDA